MTQPQLDVYVDSTWLIPGAHRGHDVAVGGWGAVLRLHKDGQVSESEISGISGRDVRMQYEGEYEALLLALGEAKKLAAEHAGCRIVLHTKSGMTHGLLTKPSALEALVSLQDRLLAGVQQIVKADKVQVRHTLPKADAAMARAHEMAHQKAWEERRWEEQGGESRRPETVQPPPVKKRKVPHAAPLAHYRRKKPESHRPVIDVYAAGELGMSGQMGWGALAMIEGVAAPSEIWGVLDEPPKPEAVASLALAKAVSELGPHLRQFPKFDVVFHTIDPALAEAMNRGNAPDPVIGQMKEAGYALRLSARHIFMDKAAELAGRALAEMHAPHVAAFVEETTREAEAVHGGAGAARVI